MNGRSRSRSRSKWVVLREVMTPTSKSVSGEGTALYLRTCAKCENCLTPSSYCGREDLIEFESGRSEEGLIRNAQKFPDANWLCRLIWPRIGCLSPLHTRMYSIGAATYCTVQYM